MGKSTSRQRLDDLLATANGDGADEMRQLVDIGSDVEALPENAKSWARLSLAFHVAAVDGVNRETGDYGCPTVDAILLAANAAGSGLGSLVVQGFDERGWVKARKALLAEVDRGIRELIASVRKHGGGT